MAEQVTEDGLTVDQIETAYEVLEVVREKHRQNGFKGMENTVNEAHCLVQRYEEHTHWQTQYDVPEPGDILTDTGSNPRYGDGKIEVVEVLEKPSSRHYIDVHTGKKSVAYMNPNHPADAPVVRGHYVEGSSKVYAFPCTRLK